MYRPKEKKGKSGVVGTKRCLDASGHALPTSSLNIPSTERGASCPAHRTTENKKTKHRYGSGKSRVYDTLNRSTSDMWRLDGDAVMWRFVAHTVARREHRPRQSQEAWPRSGLGW